MLVRDVDTALDVMCQVLVHGCVYRKELLVGASAPDAAVLAELESLGVWAVG